MSLPAFTSTHPYLITPYELSQKLNDPVESKQIALIDCTWYLPVPPSAHQNTEQKSGQEEFKKRRIADAQFLDLDECANKDPIPDVPEPLSHMMPTPEKFADYIGNLGISPDHYVILYDQESNFSAPRGLFTFKAMSHSRASILDGGLRRWIAEGYPIDQGPPTPAKPQKYSIPAFQKDWIVSYPEIVAKTEKDPAKDQSADLIIDARPAGRFHGKDSEPRPIPSGHMPNGTNLPYVGVFTPETTTEPSYKTFLSQEKLKEAFANVAKAFNVDPATLETRNFITTCGSGMAAVVLWLALELAGYPGKRSLYDESWSGYAQRKGSKIIKD